jgi:hypothetical protein
MSFRELAFSATLSYLKGRAHSTAALGKWDVKEPLHQQLSYEQALLASGIGSSKLSDQIEGPEVAKNCLTKH